MPMLFYGTTPQSHKRRLYGVNLRRIESSVFDHFKIDNLAPYNGLVSVANFWHFKKLNHSAMSWHDDYGIEQTVFFPGLLESHRGISAVARESFPGIIPSPIVFRFHNEGGVYYYD